MAYRMQTSVPELVDLEEEPDHVLDLYGPDARKKGTFAHNCLIARRLPSAMFLSFNSFTVAGTSTAICPSHP